MSTILVSYSQDLRYTDQPFVITHDKQQYPSIRCDNLKDIKEKLLEYEVIGIDEGQFYSDIVSEAEDLANKGKVVIISALSGNFKREPFEVIAKLIPKCESVNHVNAICYNCNEDANFSLRISEEEEEILIGGENNTSPVAEVAIFSIMRKE
eukprot:CAMPEP_0170515758 /NCGR_PEP_ID=MMETSP0209-20121228/2157_1 /TAXON_ID=665100 ORGANISM="Litonotus pictus, Strain P1" /NCGR_SAMPLE_ID=MMETSP0209 /ASSEMBLY_ACC=CAM_ASM_000301 /LENGTH=151 /DNA_ID=CAMNT_0010800391 /DNA_START=285 /DNA_END=741 /DNA_ORIENTATION=+